MADAPARARGHEIFDPIAAALLSHPQVDIGAMFGSEGLRVRGKVFALVSFDGRLMLKLPADRIDALEAAGDAERVSMRGRPMREWAFVGTDAAALWPPLVDEAFAFVDALTP